MEYTQPQVVSGLEQSRELNGAIQADIEIQRNTLNNVKDLLARPDFQELKKHDSWEKGIRQVRRRIASNFGAQNVTKAAENV